MKALSIKYFAGFFYPLLLLVLLGPANNLLAEENEGLCPGDFKRQQTFPTSSNNDQRTHISADSATVSDDNLTVFTGNVVAQQTDRVLKADHVEYNRRSGLVQATGELEFSNNEIRVTGDSAELNLQNGQGTIKNANYFTGSVNGRGSADSIDIKSKTNLELNNASYTTCPPGDEAWVMEADNIQLDKASQQGTADGVVLKVAHVPILYLPYIRFPIGDQRLSGFLYPGISQSDKLGTEISIPYYWNIAPHMDATITPHNMSKRGLMLETQFRYLGEQSSGLVELNYLPDDKRFGDNREKLVWVHNSTPKPGWSSAINFNYVSDTAYLDDFAGTLKTSSVTHLERNGQLDYNSDSFVFSGLVQDYQNISGEEPYQRMPQLQFNTRFTNQDNRLNYDINTEYVRFDHRDESRVVGQRVKFSPYVSFPFQADAGFVIPKLTLHHLNYNLERTAPTQKDNPNVTVPVLSLDTGLFLERTTGFAGTPLLHTLEPRLFYLYAPNEDQTGLPVFDTALTTFGQSLLFSENRFSGNDRIGDANQLTTALTTRFYRQDNGQEVLSATLGQIIYFRDRFVTLPGSQPDTSERSSYIGVLTLTPNERFRLTSDVQWNPETEHTEVTTTHLQYDTGDGRVLNLNYRFRRNEIRTQGMSFAWRTSPRWQFFGGTEYDLENDHRLENFLGVRYDDCCWGIRLVGIERFDELSGDTPRFENAIYLELELKGLSSLGPRKDIDGLLENGILGYTR